MARGQGDSRRPAEGAGRFEQWRAGWRVALRMARRDVRRHRGRSILILLMIGLPVLLISGGATLAFSMNLDQSEQEPFLFGTGQAIVSGPVDSKQITQEALGRGYGTGVDPAAAQPIPGLDADPTRAVGNLLGGKAIPLTQGPVRTEISGAKVSVNALGAALEPHADLGARARLVSGRWAANDEEVVVTSWGASLGLPTSGVLSVATTDGKDSPLKPRTIVGVAEAVTGSLYGGVSPASVVLPPWQDLTAATSGPPGDSVVWLITDRGPVTWAEVQRLNTYGLVSAARSLWTLPADELPGQDSQGTYFDSTGMATAIAMAGAAAGLLFTTALLAGPAFAVSASRQRRTLALSAANGASRAQVRRTILAQAVVLGGLATAGGMALGVGLGAALRRWLAHVMSEQLFLGLDVPWGFLAAVAGAALLSAVVAALLPARSLGRLDIVRVMRGQEVAKPVRHRITVVGLVLLGFGAVLTLTQVDVSDGMQQAGFGLIGGSALLTVGALCVVPSLLSVVGRLGRRLPLSLRMAARDSARQRARTGPTVAAVMAGAALLSGTVVAIASDTAEQAHTYVPSVATGTATTYDSTMGAAGVARIVGSVDPSIITIPSGMLVRAVSDGEMPQPWTTGPGRLVQAQRDGCTFEQSRPSQNSSPDEKCWSIGTDGMMGGGAIRTAPADNLTTLLHLDDAQRKAVAEGAIVLPDVSTIPKRARPGTFDLVQPVPTDVGGGAVSFWVADGTADENGNFTASNPPTTVRLPALVLPWDQFSLGQATEMGGYSAYLAEETAARLGWASQPGFAQLIDPDGPISRATEASLTNALQAVSENGQIRVERGFERDDTVPILVLMGVIGLIILVATLVSTALSMAEQLPMMGTLAAVGATRMTRRKLAAAQAFLLSGLGAGIGAAIGILPGIASARTVTTTSGQSYGGFARYSDAPDIVGPFVVIPWLQIAAPIVIIPIIAAVFAFASIRRAPTVTRRAT